MTARDADPADDPAPQGGKGAARVLVLVVAFLGALILVALGAVLFKIVSLATAPAEPAKASATLDGSGTVPAGRLALPAGARVKSVSLSGERLAVYYESAGQEGVAVVDLSTGAVVRRLEIAPSSP